jgi:hypothetical protein
MGEKTLKALRAYKAHGKASGKPEVDVEIHIKLYGLMILEEMISQSHRLRPICQGALANEVQRDPRIIKTETDPSGIVRLWYAREGERQDFKCRYGEGNQILVKHIDSSWDPNKGWPSFYEIKGDELKIKTVFALDFTKVGTFKLSDLK